LGIPRDADATTIKKAYRKLALKYHPDKNIATTTTTTTTTTNTTEQMLNLEQLFLQVQQAYECLSDVAERKWYDDHRDAILKGWSVATGTTNSSNHHKSDHHHHHASSSSSSSTNNPNNDIVFNVAPYMYAGCFYGFDSDSNNSFYNVYQNVFQQIYQEEVNGCSNISDVEYLAVSFGNATSHYETVVMKFYQAWESFSSILSYAWADQWNVQEAEQRRVRRAMEEDNLRARRKARKIRNDEIAALVRFVKRRDPRIVAKKEEVEQLRRIRELELHELTKQRKLEKEVANREWREHAEREALAMEEEDRINGRVRLADLDEDDYDYYGGGGKKKKRGKGKKEKTTNINTTTTKTGQLDNDDDPNDPQDEGNEPQRDNDDPSIPIADKNISNDGTLSVETSNTNTVTPTNNHESTRTVDNTSVSPSLDVPYAKWHCECCVETFENENHMKKHFKSKQHKDIAALRKSNAMTTTTTTTTNMDDSKIKRKSKQQQRLRQLEAVENSVPEDKKVIEQPKSKYNDTSNHNTLNTDSHTEDDDDDDDEEETEDVSNVVYDFDDEPLYWRCECCQKDFQSEGQMENHMNSKKHKAMYRKYEKEVGKKLLYEVVEEISGTQKNTTTLA
jgi:DnaJ family protein A protein 5